MQQIHIVVIENLDQVTARQELLMMVIGILAMNGKEI